MMQDLSGLERCLDRLVCYCEVSADLSTAKELRNRGWRLAQQWPEHCRREEEQVLDVVAEISPELAEFGRQMKQAHAAMLVRLQAFCQALQSLEDFDDLDNAVWQLKEEGKELVQQLRQHVAVEERELSGFL